MEILSTRYRGRRFVFMVHADFPGIDVGDWGYCSGMSWQRASGGSGKGDRRRRRRKWPLLLPSLLLPRLKWKLVEEGVRCKEDGRNGGNTQRDSAPLSTTPLLWERKSSVALLVLSTAGLPPPPPPGKWTLDFPFIFRREGAPHSRVRRLRC